MLTSPMGRRAFAAILASPALAAPGIVRAQEGFPSRQIRFIVPVAAGGSADAQARRVAQRLQERMGQPVVVENRPGANGIIAVQNFLQAPPDGHTVFATPSGPIAINPSLYRNLPYDPFRDFSFASLISVIPMVLAVHPSVPANNLAELVALTRRQGPAFAFANAGIGTPSHLSIAMFRSLAGGGDVTSVPFGGSAPGLTSIVGGQTMGMFDAAVSIAPFIRDGRLKGIGVAHGERLGLLPDVPTLVEQGASDFLSATWMSLCTHAATPRDRTARLSSEVDAVLREPAIRELFTSQGAFVRGGTPADFEAFARAESTKWGRLVRETGASVDS